jgi:hypothetical protein
LGERLSVEDLAEKFWRKWLDADCFERRNMLRPIAEELMKTARVKELSIDSYAGLLNSYFEDLSETCKKLWRKTENES